MAKSPFKYFRVDKNILHDPLLNTPERVGHWIQLLALAKACNCNGAFIDQFDKPMSLEQVKRFAQTRQDMISIFLDNNKIALQSGEYVIVNWAKYQDDYDRRGRKIQQPMPNDSEAVSRKTIADKEKEIKESRKTLNDSALGSGNGDLNKSFPTAKELFEAEANRLLKAKQSKEAEF